MSYDYVISLGGNCEVAAHIRRHFNSVSAYPFDWWIVPFGAVIQLFQSDFSNIFSRKDIRISKDLNSVYNKSSGIVFHHDFPRNGNQQLIESEVFPRLEFLEEKYGVLTERLRKVGRSQSRLLFVRSWREILIRPKNYPVYLIDGVPQYRFDDFRGAIESWGARNFDILFLNYGNQKIDHPNLFFRNVVDHNDAQDWSGTPKGFSEIFSQFEN